MRGGGGAGGGPSPVIPLLLVAALSMFLCWEDLLTGYEFITEIQETTVALLVILPFLVLFAVVQVATELIMIPLAFLAVVFVLRSELIGPLLILVAIYLLAKFSYYSSEEKGARAPSLNRERERDGGLLWSKEDQEEEGGGGGLGWFLFLILGVVLYAWFYQGEGYCWICFLFGLAFMFYFNMM